MSASVSKFAAGAVLLACMALPTVASAACEKVAGLHQGRFSVDRREDSAGSGRPDSFGGNWTATIDGATCAVTGEVTSDVTGKVAMTGTYDVSKDDTKFKPIYLTMTADNNPDFIELSFTTDMAKHLLRYVTIETPAYLYIGGFDGK